jgi:hypothetical protein
MPDSCHKALEIDLAAFLTEPQNPGWEEFRQHVSHCKPCAAEVSQWMKLEQVLRAVGKSTVATHPAEERLVQFRHRPDSLTPEERRSIQQHLHSCPICREGLSLLCAFDFSLLQQWVDEAQPAPASAEEKPGSFSRLIIQIAHTGLRLLESHLAAPLLDVQELFVPMPAYRSGEGPPPAINFRITTGQAAIDATVVQDGDRVALTLTFFGAEQEVLAGHQVFLRRQGRAVFSAQTDSEGVLRTPRLRPGIYEVACPGVQTTFELEFRS